MQDQILEEKVQIYEPREEWLLTFLNLISTIPGLLKNQYWNADSLASSWFFIVFFISPLQDEFCTFMQLEYAEKEDSYLRAKEVGP